MGEKRINNLVIFRFKIKIYRQLQLICLAVKKTSTFRANKSIVIDNKIYTQKHIKKQKMENVAIKAEKTKAISAEQLKKLQDFNTFMDKARLSLGELSIQYEFQKADILSQIAVQQQNFNELEKEIKEEHGDIRVNIETGEIVKLEEQ
jgi:hypothetical protein